MIYIDAGCHNGDSIKDFFSGKFFDFKALSVDPKDIISFGIDPLNTYQKEWEKITNKYGTIFIRKAVFTSDGSIDFSEKEKEKDVDCTIMKNKRRYKSGNIHKVLCFDFSKFLAGLEDDNIIVRMDIEGAEYPVLAKLITEKTIFKIKFLGIEWHAHKMLSDLDFKRQQLELIQKLNSLNINWTNKI
ncbi:MAG: FkbM family methyltransferase [Candidatus Lokiarchaeota archaeon]|nr:FkbM family methyltransferase [Candidatus Lokiarchaeota archaeon]